jgi:hypothetical protein
MLASALIALSAGLSAVLGFVHLVYTFRGSKLHPRDSELRSKLENTSLVLTAETTMWKAWIGFNASHSLGVILFGVKQSPLWIGSPATDPPGEGTIQSALSLQPPANESLKLRRLGGQE